MSINTHGGGANTNKYGLKFEQDTSLLEALVNAGYRVVGNTVYDSEEKVGLIASKHDLYRKLLEPNGVNWTKLISKRLLPDDALYVYKTNTVYIIEKKFQHSPGSVDEKLQTCDFKRKQYMKLFSPMKSTVQYLYVCNDWFKQSEYRDVHQYIKSVGCHLFFNEIPINFLEL